MSLISRSRRAALLAVTAAGALVLITACGSKAATAASSVASSAVSAGSSALSSAGSAGSSALSSAVAAGSSVASSAGSAGSSALSSAVSAGSSAVSAASSAVSSGTAAAGGALTPADIAAAKATLIDPAALTICTSLSYKPFQFTENDKVVGFDVDLVDFAAAKLGVPQKIVDTPFEGIKSGEATNTGKCDGAAAAMSITAAREKVMTFSAPYFDANQALVVPTASTAKTLADLKGKKVGGQNATTGLDYLNAQKAADGYEIVVFNDFPTQSEALLTGQIDGAVNDIPVWNQIVKDNAGKVAVVAQFNTGDKYGVGMKVGNTALKKVIDAAVVEAKANGEYDKTYKKWIGDLPKK